MYHLHLMAHQRYEERIRDAERQARFLADNGLLTTGDPRGVAAPSFRPFRQPLGLLRQIRRSLLVQRA
jgi:hypothetical protein